MVAYPDEGYSELFLSSDTALRRARQIMMAMQREEQKPIEAQRESLTQATA